MPAYLLVHRRRIKDPEGLKYYDHVEETISKFGGKVIVRADEFLVLEGNWHSGSRINDSRPERITVIEFPDMPRLQQWYDSQDYAGLKEVRENNSTSDVVAVEGVTG